MEKSVSLSSRPCVLRDFHCTSCGAALPIPKNSKGHVACPFCRNEMVIESLVKNAEIIDKENINSGVSLNATSAILHRHLFKQLAETHCIPLDAFDEVEVIREERYCYPAYCFSCNATASYMCEVGKAVKSRTTEDLGDKVQTTTYTDIQWEPLSGNVSVTKSVTVPGNKASVQQIIELYSGYDHNRFEDVEDLVFPPDTESHKYNLPIPVAFDQYAAPMIEELLGQKVKDHLSNRNVRNITFGGSNTQKDTVRLYLGLYHIIYKYGSSEYSCWATGDGQKCWHDKPLPPDPQRVTAYQTKEAAASVSPKSAVGWIVGAVICGVIAFFTFTSSVLLGLLLLAGAGGLGYGYVPAKKRADEHNAQLEHAKADFESFKSQETAVIQRFKQQNQALRGIYSDCTGDASAF
jgi:hypothetical protein